VKVLQAENKQHKETILQQSSAIAELRAKLGQLEKRVTEPTDGVLGARADRLKGALEAEKSAHTNTQLRFHKQVKDLEADNQKLRVSLSNAQAALGRRGKDSPMRR
jgi:hypothetical protein